jgi:ribosomal protein S24E
MSFKVELLEEKKNDLINRTEIRFRIDHFGKGTPNRLEVKKKVAAMKNANERLTIIRNMNTHFGSAYIMGKVNIYEDPKDLQFYEPFHIQVRNLEPEKRTEIYRLKKRKEPFKHLLEFE